MQLEFQGAPKTESNALNFMATEWIYIIRMHIETTAKKWREKLFLGCENVCYWAASGHLYRALSQNLDWIRTFRIF